MGESRDGVPRDTNGWSRAEMHVLESLDRLEAGQRELQGSVANLDRTVATLTTGLAQLDVGERRMNDHSRRLRALEGWRWFLAGGLVLLGALVKVLL